MTRRIILGTVLAIVVLAGCGQGSNPAPAASATAATLACRHSYQGWKSGPARTPLNQLLSALKDLQAAGSAKNIPAVTAAVRKAGRAAARLASFAVPACADPHGYFAAILARVRAAAARAGTTKGLSALVRALAPLTGVPGA